jgi:hypothetical protein
VKHIDFWRRSITNRAPVDGDFGGGAKKTALRYLLAVLMMEMTDSTTMTACMSLLT